MKKILVLITILFLGTTAFAGSYLDRQIKDSKKNSHYNTVQHYKKVLPNPMLP